MDPSAPEKNGQWSSRTVGSLIGSASAITVFVLLAFRSQGFAILLILSFGLWGVLTLVALMTIGAVIGRGLAMVSLIPPLRPITTLAIAFAVALGPLTAGFIEVALREPPLTLPNDAINIQWKRAPWGEMQLTFESGLDVPVLHNQLVLSAKEKGWVCRYCQYQPSTGSGHASFRFREFNTDKPSGRLGFEVSSGQKALYGLPPSDLTQVRIFSQQRTLSVELSALTIFALSFLGMIYYFRRCYPNE